MTVLVVDTSAVVAVLSDEPGADELRRELDEADRRVMSAATLVELGIVIEARRGPGGRSVLEQFLRDAEVEVLHLDRRGADRALEGWRRFGTGRHRAALKLGDCFAYGLALDLDCPVLCTGDDFAATDIAVVRPG